MAPKVDVASLEKTLNEQNLSERGTQNATTPPEQRVINPAVPLSDGPIKGEDGEGYMPASYKTTRGNVRTDR